MNKIIPYNVWSAAAKRHQDDVENLLSSWREFKTRGEKHPVVDFLFQYYSFPYHKLLSWTPGLGEILELPFHQLLSKHRFEVIDNTIVLKKSLLPVKRFPAVLWVKELLEKSAQNPACFNCYGMHEWAMVYKTDTVRHEYKKLRFNSSEIIEIVEARELNCTHYDAFRFFSPAAVPKNKHQLSREYQENFEQSACLHVNMDLYKWAYKIYPFISSDLLLATFKLALACRTVDMQASPYDLRDLGYEPIRVETAEGREEYVREQLRLKKMAEPIRLELLNNYKKLIEKINELKIST